MAAGAEDRIWNKLIYMLKVSGGSPDTFTAGQMSGIMIALALQKYPGLAATSEAAATRKVMDEAQRRYKQRFPKG